MPPEKLVGGVGVEPVKNAFYYDSCSFGYGNLDRVFADYTVGC